MGSRNQAGEVRTVLDLVFRANGSFPERLQQRTVANLGDNAYWLIVTALMTSITLAATGLLMGLVVVVERRRTRALGTSPA